jgi:hypothetical protein
LSRGRWPKKSQAKILQVTPKPEEEVQTSVASKNPSKSTYIRIPCRVKTPGKLLPPLWKRAKSLRSTLKLLPTSGRLLSKKEYSPKTRKEQRIKMLQIWVTKYLDVDNKVLIFLNHPANCHSAL